MRQGARYQAVIDILTDFDGKSVPLDTYLDHWARANRYAGSKDRRFIRDVVFAVMRRRSAYGWAMGGDEPRAWLLGYLAIADRLPLEQLAPLCDGSKHHPAPLSDDETAVYERLQQGTDDLFASAPAHIRAHLPEWLADLLTSELGDRFDAEMARMCERAPMVLRVNTIRTDRKAAADSLAAVGVSIAETPLSRLGLQVLPSREPGAYINIRSTKAYLDGLVEIQDESAQIAAALVKAEPKQHVLDLCAGGGGKTLALAAVMENTGQIFACDIAPKRLDPIKVRMKRADLRNVQPLVVQDWAGEGADPDFAEMRDGFDRVILDVPCSGSGVWRRSPDAKWRLTPEALEHYVTVQSRLLDRAAPLVKPGGYIIYVTCSILRRENGAQLRAFLDRSEHYEPVAPEQAVQGVQTLNGAQLLEMADLSDGLGLSLSPTLTATDGAYVAVLRRRH